MEKAAISSSKKRSLGTLVYLTLPSGGGVKCRKIAKIVTRCWKRGKKKGGGDGKVKGALKKKARTRGLQQVQERSCPLNQIGRKEKKKKKSYRKESQRTIAVTRLLSLWKGAKKNWGEIVNREPREGGKNTAAEKRGKGRGLGKGG